MKNADEKKDIQTDNKTFCLLGATFNTDNMGVGALTAGAIKCILSIYPEAKISLLDYGKERIKYHYNQTGRDITIELINMRFSKNIFLKNHIAFLIMLSFLLRFIPFRSLQKKIISTVPVLDDIYRTEVFLSVAGGDSFSDIYGIKRFFYISLPQFLILLTQKKLILLPQTIGPFESKMSRLFARWIVNKSNLVFSRDQDGIDEIKKLIGKKFKSGKVKMCYDMGFVLDPEIPKHLDLGDYSIDALRGSTVVGFNISGLLLMGGYTKKNMFGLLVDYRDLVYSTIELLIKEKHVKILLIPHVFGKDIYSESDAVACEEIYTNVKSKYGTNILMAQGRYNQNEIKYIIGLCDFFIGSRMHACIAALSQNIPAVSLSYSKKFLGVMDTIGVSNLVLDPRVKTKEEILLCIDMAFKKRYTLHETLKKEMPLIKQTVLNLFETF